MDKLQFVPLNTIPAADMLALMNHPKVGAYLPLLNGPFTEEHYHAFIKAKKQLWERHGYGPWAFVIDGQFAGWGGLQYENGEVDFALVLHPKFWGWGLKIFQRIKGIAFGPMRLQTITALLPPNRPNSKAIERLGFKPTSTVNIGGQEFVRFVLAK